MTWHGFSFIIIALCIIAVSPSPVALSRRALFKAVPVLVGGSAAAAAIVPSTARADPVGEYWPDLDGAIGWNWGGKDRCAPDDLTCRDNGQTGLELKVASPPSIPAGVSVSKRCRLGIELAGKPLGRLDLALWGESPTIDVFAAMCGDGAFLPPTTGLERDGRTFGPWTWRGASVEKVEPGRVIAFGKVKAPSSLTRREERELEFDIPPPPKDAKPLKSDGAGFLVMRPRLSGIQFGITTGAGVRAGFGGPEWIPIGQVEGEQGMKILAILDGMPLNKYSQAPLRRVAIASVGGL